MLFLHEANLRDLKWNGEPLFEASRAELKEVLNGDCQLKVVYPITDSKLFEQLVVDKLISVPSPTLGTQFFRIKSLTEEDDSLELLCDPISYDIMKRRIKPLVVNGTDCQTALNRMVASNRTRLGDFHFESDITTPHVYTSEEEETLYTVLMDGKHSILGTWEGELVRDNRLIAIKGQRGEDRGEVLSTHHNISSYQRELDASAVYTRIIVHSSFKPEGGKEDRHLEVTVDSPLINNYPYINEVVFENNQLTDIETMKTWAKAKFTHDGIDKVKDSLTIKAYQVDGTTLHLGDTVSIKSKLHKADFKKKVVGYTWDALSESYIDFTFDDQVVYGGTSQSPMNDLASEILHANDHGLSAIQAEIDASNRRFDLKEEKLREEIDSGISRAEAKAEEQVAQVNQTISVLQEKAKQLTELSSHHDSLIASHLSKLNETTELAKVAKQEAVTAQNLAKTSQTAASTALSKALEYRNEAIAEATRLDGIQRQAIDSQIAIAKTQAVGEASQLIEKAKTLLNQQVSTVSIELMKTKDVIRLLATKTEVTEIGKRVSSAESSLQVQAGQIASKANKADVDAVSGRLTSAESTIQQQANEISQRVKTTDFNKATQRLSTTESSITQLGNRITTEISDVSGKISNLKVGSRNYAEDYDFSRGLWEYSQGDSSPQNWTVNDGVYTVTTSTNTWHQLQIHSESGSRLGGKADSLALLEPKIGETYTLSVEVKVNSGDPNFWVEVRDNGKSNYNHVVTHIGGSGKFTQATNEWVRYSFTGVFKSNSDFGHRRIILGYTAIGSLSFRKVELTHSTVFTDAGPAPEDAMSEIESAKTTITQTAQGVSQLSTKVSQAEGKLTTAETKINQLVGEVSSKVSKTDYDNLKKTVTSQGTAITQANNAIALKAEKTYVDGVKTTADSAKATARDALSKAQTNSQTISQTKAALEVANSVIQSKVSQTDFNAATKRLATAETTITQQAGEISKRLTSTQVESAITAKGYQTKAQVDSNITGRGYQTKAQVDSNITGRNLVTTTVLDNRVTETVNGYTRDISRVESLIPSDVSERNLAKGSSNDWSTYTNITSNSNWIHHLTNVPYGGYGNTGIVTGTKVNLFVHIGVDSLVLDSTITNPRITVQGGGYKKSDNTKVWSVAANPLHGSWTSPLKAGNNYFVVKVTKPVQAESYNNYKSFDIEIRIDGVSTGKVRIKGLMVTTGDIFPKMWQPPYEDLATATKLQKLESTVEGHTRTFTQLGTLPDTVKWSTIKQTMDKVTTTIGDSTAISKTVQTALVSLQIFKDLQTGLSSQQSLTANHYALKFLKATSDVLTQLNLNTGGVKIQGKLIHLSGQTLIDDGVITSAKIASLDAGKITTGYLSANRIAAQAITGDKIKFDLAFFNQMTANEALFKTIFAKSAFITAVQSVTLSANRIVGGLLTAMNNAMSINLNQANMTFNSSATIDFNSSGNALKRKVGDVTGFLHFNNASAGGTYVGLGVTSHNEGVKSQDTARFAGVRIFRSNDKVDQTEIYGDTIFLGHAFNGNALTVAASKLNASYEMVDIINAIKALWRCWLHFNNVRWNPADSNFSRAVINEYNAHNIG